MFGSCWHPYCSDISAAAAVPVVVGIIPVFGAPAFVVVSALADVVSLHSQKANT